jgi:hypothetical protein
MFLALQESIPDEKERVKEVWGLLADKYPCKRGIDMIQNLLFKDCS